MPFYSLVTFKYLHFCVRIMDLGIEMYEAYLIQVAGAGTEMADGTRDGNGSWLAWLTKL